MKPEDLLNPADLPDDLKWLPTHYKLHPSDPVYLLIAWHWRRVKQSEDTLRAAIVEMKAALDSRIELLAESAETVAGVNESLAATQGAIDGLLPEIEAQLEAKLSRPIADAAGQIKTLEKSLMPLGKQIQMAKRRYLLAALLIGVALGVLSAVIVLFA